MRTAHPAGADRRPGRAPGAGRAPARSTPPRRSAGSRRCRASTRPRRTSRSPRASRASRARSSRRRSTPARVVKTTIMRLTLHLAAADDYPAYAQLSRHARMRTLAQAPSRTSTRSRSPPSSRAWFARAAHATSRCASASAPTRASPPDPWTPVLFARTLLPLVQLPPAGHWDDSTARRASSLDPRPLPDPADAATLVLDALPRRLRPRVPARRRRLGGRRPARLRRGVRAARDRRLPRRAGPRADRPARPRRSRPPTRRCPPRFSALGPAAARLRRPRADHPARGPAAEAHAQRRADGHRRRPRRRQLERPRRRAGAHAAGRAVARAAGRGEGGGAAHRAVLRRKWPVEREKPPRGRLVRTFIGTSPAAT